MSNTSASSTSSVFSSSSGLGAFSHERGQRFFPSFLVDRFLQATGVSTTADNDLFNKPFFFQLPSAVLYITLQPSVPFAFTPATAPPTPSPTVSPSATNTTTATYEAENEDVEEKKVQELFHDLLSSISNHHGDVAVISGCRIVALWPTNKTQEPPEATLLRTFTCALATAKLASVTSAHAAGNWRISFCISFGSVSVLIVGGYLKWKYVVTGSAIDEAGELAQYARQHVLHSSAPLVFTTEKAYQASKDFCEVDRLSPKPVVSSAKLPPDCSATSPILQLLSVNKKISAPIARDSATTAAVLVPSNRMSPVMNPPPPENRDQKRLHYCLRLLTARFVPEHLQQIDEWSFSRLSDLRLITLLCVHFPNLCFSTTEPQSSPTNPEEETEGDEEQEREQKETKPFETELNTPLLHIQRVVNLLQAMVSHFGGSIYDIEMGKEGTTFVLVFGLPTVNEDDALRGSRVGVEIKRSEHHNELPSSLIGIATGRVLYCSIGTSNRRDLVVVGKATTQAVEFARSCDDSIAFLCDEMTTRGCGKYGRTKLRFECFNKTGSYFPLLKDFQPPQDSETIAMLGRDEEKDFLESKLADLQDGFVHHILIEGEEGMGKTMLMNEVRERLCPRLGIPCYYTTADCMEKNTPWFAWRNIFLQLWNMPALTSMEQVITREQVLHLTKIVGKQLEEEPQELGPFGSLLNTVVPVFFPENKTVSSMPPLARADKVRDMLLYLLLDPTEQARVVIIEDIQWLDSASKTLIFFACKRIKSLMFIFTTREILNPAENDDLRQFKTNVPGLIHRKLLPLAETETGTLIRSCLNSLVLLPSVANLIFQKSHGNPFFCQEIVQALKLSGALVVDSSGYCNLNMLALSRSVTFTDTIERVISSRVDSLSGAQKRALRVASVIGTKFDIATLRKLCTDPDLSKTLDSLRKLNFLTLVREDKQLSDYSVSQQPTLQRSTSTSFCYAFTQHVIQAVVYASIAPAEKEDLHRQLAELLESIYHQREDPSTLNQLLAFHWGRAHGSLLKSIKYLERAASKALSANANKEAISHYLELLSHSGNAELQNRITPTVLAQWERHLAEAYFLEGNVELSLSHLEHALGVLGFPKPSANSKTATSVGQLLRQAWYSLSPVFNIVPVPSEEPSSRTYEATLIYELLSEIYFLENQRGSLVFSAIQAMIFARDLGFIQPFVKALSTMSYAAGWSSLPSYDEKYRRKGQELATRVINSSDLLSEVALGAVLRDWVQGELVRATSTLENSIATLERVHAVSHVRCFSLCSYGAILMSMGQTERAAQQFRDCVVLSDDMQDRMASGFARLGEISVDFLSGNTTRARVLIEEIPTRFVERQGVWSSSLFRLWFSGLKAVVCWRLKEDALARRELEESLESLGDLDPICPFVLFGLNSLAEVAVGLLGSHLASEPEQRSYTLEQNVEVICGALTRFASRSRFAVPASHLWQGLSLLLSSNPSKAVQSWRRAEQEATKISVVFEKTLASRLLAAAELGPGQLRTVLTSCTILPPER